MKEFIIITAIFVGLAVLVEYTYLRCLAEVNKLHFRLPKKRVVTTKTIYVGRPDLDFDLHVKEVDKIRFGDEV